MAPYNLKLCLPASSSNSAQGAEVEFVSTDETPSRPQPGSNTTAPYATRSTSGIYKKRQLKDAAHSSDEEFPLRISPKKSKTGNHDQIDLSTVNDGSESPTSPLDEFISVSPVKLGFLAMPDHLSEPDPFITTSPILMEPFELNPARFPTPKLSSKAMDTSTSFVEHGTIDHLSNMFSVPSPVLMRRSITLDDDISYSEQVTFANDVTPKAKSVNSLSARGVTVTPVAIEDELEPHEIQRILRVYAQNKRAARLNAGSTPYPSSPDIDIDLTPTPASYKAKLAPVPESPMAMKQKSAARVSSANINPSTPLPSRAASSKFKLDHPDGSDADATPSQRLHLDEQAQLIAAINESKADLVARNMSKIRVDISNAKPATTARKMFKDVFKPVKTTPMMSNGPLLLEDTMKFVVLKLPSVCEVTKPMLQDMFLHEDYADLPHLLAGCLISWNATSPVSVQVTLISFSEWSAQCPGLDFEVACAAICFVRHGHFINPSRISPRDVNILYTSQDHKKSVLQCNFKTAICLSSVFVLTSQLLVPSSTGLRNKYLSGYMHSQEWERFEGFACMVFDKPTMIVQVHNEALTFGTMGTPKERESSSSSRGPHNPKIFSSSSPHKPRAPPTPRVKTVLDSTDDIPVYDARNYPTFDFASDLDNIASVLPLYPHEIPYGSFAVVAYTMGHYSKGPSFPNLTTNISFVILFATE